MNLVLCGLPKSGKTTLGKLVAKRLSKLFIDTDDWIEESYLALKGKKLTCREICLNEGEIFFRELEKNQIERLCPSSNAVIALGGGALHDPDFIKTIGLVIYLKNDPEVIWNRVEKIPLSFIKTKEEFFSLVQKRSPIYEKAAHITIDCIHSSLEDITAKIMVHYGK